MDWDLTLNEETSGGRRSWPCLVCSLPLNPNQQLQLNGPLIAQVVEVFSKYFKVSPAHQSHLVRQFPFCEKCLDIFLELNILDEELRRIQTHIHQLTAPVSLKLIQGVNEPRDPLQILEEHQRVFMEIRKEVEQGKIHTQFTFQPSFNITF